MPTRDHRFRTRIDRLIYRLKYQYSMGSVGHSLDFSTKARRRHFIFSSLYNIVWRACASGR